MARKAEQKIFCDGIYTWGHEMNILSCGDKNYWLWMDAEVREKIVRHYNSLTTKPYEPVWLGVFGSLSSKPLDGFAASASYGVDAYFEVASVEYIFSMKKPIVMDCPLETKRETLLCDFTIITSFMDFRNKHIENLSDVDTYQSLLDRSIAQWPADDQSYIKKIAKQYNVTPETFFWVLISQIKTRNTEVIAH